MVDAAALEVVSQKSEWRFKSSLWQMLLLNKDIKNFFFILTVALILCKVFVTIGQLAVGGVNTIHFLNTTYPLLILAGYLVFCLVFLLYIQLGSNPKLIKNIKDFCIITVVALLLFGVCFCIIQLAVECENKIQQNLELRVVLDTLKEAEAYSARIAAQRPWYHPEAIAFALTPHLCFLANGHFRCYGGLCRPRLLYIASNGCYIYFLV